MNTFSRDSLHQYQKEMVEKIKDTDKCALWVDMGLGKTVIVLSAIADLFYEFEIKKVLIVAPLKVALRVWPNEIEKWEHTRSLTYTVLHGGVSSRTYRASMDTNIHIINRENLVWLFEHLKRTNHFPYDMIVIDESSSFKNRTAKRTTAALKMSFMADRIIELTATPASNSLIDLWSQIAILDHGERLGKSYSSYLNNFFVPSYMGNSYSLMPNSGDKIYSLLSDICFRLDGKDYLQLPPKIEHSKLVELPPEIREQYSELEKDFLLKVGTEQVVFNSGAQVNKLLQFCNGAVYHDGSYSIVHDLKIDALEELIEECGEEPLLVAYLFRSDAERIKIRFPEAVILDRKGSQIPAWNSGEIKLMLVHPASSGHGVNLQHGGRAICWFGLPWSLELYEQFIGRVYRQGQTKPVIIYTILIQNSADMEVKIALTRKDKGQKALLDGVIKSIQERQNLGHIKNV